MQSARQSIREGPFQRLFWSVFPSRNVKTTTLLTKTKLWEFLCRLTVNQSFAGSCHQRGRMSWVPRSRKCTSCVPRPLLHVYHTQTRPKGPHSLGNKPAAQRGTPPNVYPLILSMTWKETYRRRNDAIHTRHGWLGRESSTANGHRTKIPWTRFDNKAIRFFPQQPSTQLIHLKTDGT